MSLPRIQLLIRQMIKSVFNAIESAFAHTVAQGLSSDEVKHAELCVKIVEQSITELSAQVDQITVMNGLV